MQQVAAFVLVLALSFAQGQTDGKETFVTAKNVIDPHVHEPIATVAAAAIAPVFRPLQLVACCLIVVD